MEDNIVRTEKGAVTADQIVFATHYPFVNFPGLYFTRMHQERSYVLALENAGNIEGVYIGDGEEMCIRDRLGGVLVYGIPEFRLPKQKVVAKEIEKVKELGVKFETNVVIGKSTTIDQRMEDEGFESVFIG